MTRVRIIVSPGEALDCLVGADTAAVIHYFHFSMSMNKIVTLLLTFVVAFYSISGVWSDEFMRANENAGTSVNFSEQLFTVVSETNKDNVVFSPFSIRMAMGIAGLGANGQTLAEITEAMRLKSLEKEFPAIISMYGIVIKSSDENAHNAAKQLPVKQDLQVFIKKGVTVEDGFFEAVKEISGVEIKELGANSEILSGGAEENLEHSQLVIRNILKFSGRWSNPFSSVCSLPFHLEEERAVPAMFMVDDEQFFEVVDFGDRFGFLLNFAKENPTHPDFAMIFIVPKEIGGIDDIMKGIAEGLLSEWITKICTSDNPKNYRLYLPRFTMNTSLELKESLISMGMKSAFDVNADFSKLSHTPLCITHFFHTAHIDVDEYGVEASAETSVFYGAIGLRRTPIVRLDRPFVYLIYDKSNHQVLFMGRCDNPVNSGTLVPSDEQPRLSEHL